MRDRNAGTQPNFKKCFLMWNFVAEKQLLSLFFAASAANLQRSQKSINDVTPTSDIVVSGLIQHTKTNGQWPPILLLLQTEINCDNVHHKIYHRTSNLLVHYLVK